MPRPVKEKTKFNNDLIEVVLGSYNFDKFMVTLGLDPDPSLNPVTLEHEFLHQRLNRESTFGQAIERFNALVREGKLGRNALVELVSRCDRVHETLAIHNSIIRYERRDLVPRLPTAYQKYFREMEQALFGVPNIPRWRSSSCWHLSRMCMLVGLGEIKTDSPDKILKAAKNALSPNERREIVLAEMKHFDLARFKELMKKWGADDDFLEAFLSEKDTAAIKNKLASTKEWRDWKKWDEIESNFELFMMHAFLDYFERILPEVQTAHEDAHSNSFFESAAYAFGPGTDATRDPKLVQLLIEACNQNVLALPGVARPRRLRSSITIFKKLAEASLSKFGCLFMFIFNKNSSPVFHLVHVSEPGSGFVDHYKLNMRELASLMMSQSQIITLVETKYPLANTPFPQRMNMFGSLTGNPIKRFEALFQEENQEIRWWHCRIGHQSGPLRPELSLELCLYWIAGNDYPFFHLSNEMMGNAIHQYGELMQRTGIAFSALSQKEVFARIPQEAFIKFIDHAALNYYLIGQTARSALGVPGVF